MEITQQELDNIGIDATPSDVDGSPLLCAFIDIYRRRNTGTLKIEEVQLKDPVAVQQDGEVIFVWPVVIYAKLTHWDGKVELKVLGGHVKLEQTDLIKDSDHYWI